MSPATSGACRISSEPPEKSSLASPRGPAQTDGDKGVMVGAPFRIPKIFLPNRFTNLCRLVSRRPHSTTPSGPTNPGKTPAPVPVTAAGEAEGGGGREDAYKQLQNLDFMMAAKILFTTPPRKKKFGLDFHLVQLFFTCLPSLAVYLVAQYARHEMRRMEAELEGKKKQAEEEEKAKEVEADSIKEESDPVICKVMVRLGALEEAVKEIVGEKKKTVDIKDQGASKKEPVTSASKKSDAQSEPKAGEAAPDTSKKLVPPTGDPSDNNER